MCVEPPAGIEPATPSLPSMVGPFGVQRGTSLRSTEPQVTGPVEHREMGCCEAVCGAAAGKSLARIQVGCPVVAGLRDVHVRGSGNGSKPVELLERVIGPRSDSNRRPSDYESKSLRPAGAAQTRSGCSGQRGRLLSALLTCRVTAGGMTKGMTNAVTAGQWAVLLPSDFVSEGSSLSEVGHPVLAAGPRRPGASRPTAR